MADEAGNAAKEALEEVLRISASGGGFSFNITSDNAQVVRDVCITAVTLGAIYAGYKLISKKIDGAVKRSLGGDRPDQDPPEVKAGSLHVFLHCKTDERFLEVLDEFESGRMKECFEKGFREIEIEVQGLNIEIENMQEVTRTKLAIEERMLAEHPQDVENVSVDSAESTKEIQDVEDGKMADLPWEKEEKRNFIFMDKIISEVLSEGLRTIFKQEWNRRYQAKFGAWDDTDVSGQQLFNLEQTQKRPNKNIYQAKFQNGDTRQWDCKVLFHAILLSNSIGKAGLSPVTVKEVDNLRRLQNIVKHDSEGRLSENDFQRMTTDVENAFKALGLPTNKITRIRAERNRFKSFQVLPPKPAHDVIPRIEKIREISEDLEKLRNEGKLTYFYISGNPGSGKSQLASQVCQNIWQGVNRFEEPIFVMTLNGKDVNTLLNSYKDFARRLNCDEGEFVNILNSTETKEEKIKDLRSLIATRIKNWKKWWLVVDDVENLATTSTLLPLTSDDDWNYGQIILTTQNRNHVPSDSSLTKHVSISSGMSDLESHHLLSSLSGCDDNDPLLDEVAEQLDRQPLSMAAAAVYFKRVIQFKSEFSWHDYLEKLEKGQRQITEDQLRNISPAYPSTMTAAILLAVEKCIANDSNLKHAFQFFSLVSFESMPLDLVAKYIQLVDENFDQEEFILAIQQCSLFLPAENEDGDIRMHRVVHEVVQFVCERNTKAERAHVFQTTGAVPRPTDIKRQLQNAALTLYHFKDRDDKVKLVPHLTSLNEAVKKFYPEHEKFYQDSCSMDTNKMFKMYMLFGTTLHQCFKLQLSLDFFTSSLQLSQGLKDELCLADVYSGLGNVYKSVCEYEKAKHYHQQGLEIRKKHLGEKHIDVASSYNNLGEVHRCTGEVQIAKDYHQRALEIRIEQLGEKHVHVATSYNNLGNVYRHIGEMAKAMGCFETALDIYKDQLGEKHIHVALSYNNLGVMYEITGDYKKAMNYHLRALAIYKQQLGETHVDVAASYTNLGIVHEITGDYEKAKNYHLRALEIYKIQLGEKHVDVARSYSNLGSVYQITGAYEKAMEYHLRALEIRKEQLGDRHFHVAVSYNNLGDVYAHVGEVEKAKVYFETARDIYEEQLGERHIYVACCYNNLGQVYRHIGELVKAKEYFERALNIRKEQLGERHVDVATSYDNLGLVRQLTGEYEKATDYHLRALEIRKEQLGEEHVDVAISYNNLGLVYQATAKNEKAKDCFQRSLRLFIQQLGENHLNVATSYNNLGVVYENNADYERAMDYFQRALEIRKEKLGKRHVDVAASCNSLGAACRQTGQMEKAKDYHQRALEIYEEKLGKKHTRVASSYHNLGCVYEITGEYEEAKDYYERSLEIRKQQPSEEHVDVAASYSSLGLVYKITGDYEKAKDYHLRALEVRKQHLGEKHAHVADSYNSLGIVYQITGDEEKANDCLQRALEIDKEQRIRS